MGIMDDACWYDDESTVNAPMGWFPGPGSSSGIEGPEMAHPAGDMNDKGESPLSCLPIRAPAAQDHTVLVRHETHVGSRGFPQFAEAGAAVGAPEQNGPALCSGTAPAMHRSQLSGRVRRCEACTCAQVAAETGLRAWRFESASRPRTFLIGHAMLGASHRDCVEAFGAISDTSRTTHLALPTAFQRGRPPVGSRSRSLPP